MKARSRITVIVITAAVTWMTVRGGLPALLTWLTNFAIQRIPGVRGSVRRVQIHFMAPGLTVRGVSLTTLSSGAPEHRMEVSAIALNSQWKTLLTGGLVGSLRVDAPRLFLDADGIRRANS